MTMPLGAEENWHDESSGYSCKMVRSRQGHMCGYVSVPIGHPAHGRDYSDYDSSMNVHGGLTFSRQGVAGEWWFGFDCNHHGDTYDRCNPEYVRRECEKLARQLQEMARETGDA